MTKRKVATEARSSPQPRVERTCVQCGKSFPAMVSQIRAGNGQMCSRACRNASMQRDPRIDFWDRVDRSGGPEACWPWLGRRNGHGYGEITSRVAIRDGYRSAHRLAYDLAHPDAPLGDRLACHHCDNPPCCNPAHLFAGDVADNNRDAWSKGRGRTTIVRLLGTEHPQARLTDDAVRAIRQRYAAGGVSQQALAAEFGVAVMTINRVLLRRTWTHV